jgi:hypothetical protein
VNAADEGVPVAAPGDGPPPARQLGTGSGERTSAPPLASRSQPLLLAAGVALVVPYLVAVAAPWPVLVLAALVIGWGLLIAWQRRHGDLDPHRTMRLGQLESLGGTVAYVLLLVVDGGRHPTATLLLGAGIVATVAILDPPPVRWAVQSVTLLAASVAVGLAGAWLDGVFVGSLLGVVAVVSNVYAAERQAAAERQDRARRDVDRRTQLLAAIGRLPDDDTQEAARAVVATLRELDYDAAAVELVRGDHLEFVAIDGMPALPPPPRGQGLGWQAILERRTVTTDRYPRTAWRLPGREGVHAGVATPIVVDGEAIGCVIGLRVAADAASELEMEIAEVLAVHLGAVQARLERERWQRGQLDQLDRLRHLHAELAVALGVELRAPLTEFRQLGAAVVAADVDDQRELAERFARRTEDVFRTVEIVLAIGRSQAESGAPSRRAVDVRDLLAPVARATGVEVELSGLAPGSPGRRVDVAAPFVQGALELLMLSGSRSAFPPDGPGAAEPPRTSDAGPPGGAVGFLGVRLAPEHVVVTVVRGAGAPTGVARSVAARLLHSAGAELDVGADLVVRLPSAIAGSDGRRASMAVLA